MPRVYNKHHKDAPADAVYVGRPSKWGNPFVIGKDGTRVQVIKKYRDWIETRGILQAEVKKELQGKDLVCWCTPAKCHADILLEIANGDDK